MRKQGLVVLLAGVLALGSLPAVTEAAPSLLQKTIADTGTDVYAGKVWRVDAVDRDKLPRNFRTTQSAFRDPDKKNHFDKGYVPTRQGLDKLDASGSAQYSVHEFKQMAAELKKLAHGPIYIFDLRQETHGFINGNAVSWYGKRDWGNVGKSHKAAIKDEKERLQAVKGKLVQLSPLDKDKKAADLQLVKVESAMTEAELVRSAGMHYVRITATDHVWPAAENIDAFIKLYHKLPQNAWLHFHCEAGKGRTTTYMSMYDMMRNPEVPLKDILYRQHMIGGNYVGYRPKAGEGGWKAPYYNEKADNIAVFYKYVQANHKNGYKVLWSQWLKEYEQNK